MLVEAQPTKLNIKEDPKLFEDAKAYFTKHFGKTNSILPQTNVAAGSSQTIEPISITPEWTQAVIAPYLQKYPILVVPVEDIKQFNVGTTTYKLVFFRDSLGEIQAKLNIAVPDSSYGVSHAESNVQDFTGCFFHMDMQGKLSDLLRVKEGKFTKRGRIVFGRNTIRLSTRDGECDAPDPTDCPTWGRKSWLQVVIDGVGGFFEWVGNGLFGGETGSSVGSGGYFDYGGGTYYDNTGGTGSSGSTSTSSTGAYPNTNYLIDEIGNEIFDLTEERATLLYINIRLSMTYQETQFLRINRAAAVQIENYLRNNTTFLGAENGRAHLTLLINDVAYRTANQQAFYSSNIIESLGRYKKAGFTADEFARLYDNKVLSQQVEAFLNRQNYSVEAYNVAKIHTFLSQKQSYKNALIATNYDNRVIDALLQSYRNNELATILHSDCHSWSYQPVSGGTYQACGMAGMYYDVFWVSFDPQTGKLELEYFNETLDPHFFEFPRIRAFGTIVTAAEAAESSADAFDAAESQTEKFFAKQTNRPSLTQVEAKFVETLKKLMENRGGRFSKFDNYNVGVNSQYSTSFFIQYCQ